MSTNAQNVRCTRVENCLKSDFKFSVESDVPFHEIHDHSDPRSWWCLYANDFEHSLHTRCVAKMMTKNKYTRHVLVDRVSFSIARDCLDTWLCTGMGGVKQVVKVVITDYSANKKYYFEDVNSFV